MAPIWESHPRLLCRGETYVMCDLATGSCEQSESSAIFSVDFAAETVATFGGTDYPERIVGRAHFISDIEQMRSHSSIYTNSAGRVMSFAAPTRSAVMGEYVPATMTNAGVSAVITHSLRCARQ
jgi:hypothetical protein